ncbi:efflux RND transporter periplasmic adaptor subunit [Idiomarina seosinensis]|uniref:Multidrug resistance protein MdtA-like barrel-sandwich hybrid domain-containing protein n=1 Tax=Idiomarina seosinensis TaxID=281739 RepID=A0A432ZBL5_9GAMM|nr:efflux RND transporter periplasmic adaptor subunit [Idiomarina seosinensis]RUO75328.1 hypothetical protein CWI81_10165 [Idiomarina seosinensis]
MNKKVARLVSYGVFAVFLTACSDNSQTDTETTATPVATVAIETAETPSSEYTAALVPRYQTDLGFQVSGKVSSRQVEAGQKVSKGQTLATLDDVDYVQRKQAAEAALKAAKQNLQKAENDLRRGKELYQSNAIGEQQLESYQLAYESAQDQFQQAQSQQQQAQNALEYTRLKAPESGTVVAINADPGLVVSAGQPVVQLAQGEQHQVVFDLPADKPVTESATLMLNGQELPLSLFSQSGALDPLSFTRRVRYNLEQPLDDALFGQLATVLVVNTDYDNGQLLAVPIAAIDQRGEHAQIWRIESGKAATTEVQVMELTTQQALIKSDNLAVGDVIISQGINRITEGQSVKAVN